MLIKKPYRKCDKTFTKRFVPFCKGVQSFWRRKKQALCKWIIENHTAPGEIEGLPSVGCGWRMRLVWGGWAAWTGGHKRGYWGVWTGSHLLKLDFPDVSLSQNLELYPSFSSVVVSSREPLMNWSCFTASGLKASLQTVLSRAGKPVCFWGHQWQVDVQPVTNRVGKVDAGTMYGTDTKKQCRSIHIGSNCKHET